MPSNQLSQLDQFPECHHLGEQIEPERHHCHAPQLVGLRIASPQVCHRCTYREVTEDREAASGREISSGVDDIRKRKPPKLFTADLFPCAYRGNRLTDQPQAVYTCTHPGHQTTTAVQCRECQDYLFPVMAAELPTAMATRLLPIINPQLQPAGWWQQENAQRAFRRSADDFIRQIPSYPGSFADRGIVIAGGGRYFVSTYVTVRVLRHVGCNLPIEIWHFAGEIDATMRALLQPFDIQLVNASDHPAAATFRFHSTWWKGWQLKPFAITHSSFREVLYLDADCYPVRDPADIFNWQTYCERGAIFFPDIEQSKGLLPTEAPAVFGVSDFVDQPSESGQLVINKEFCWRELQLALYYNQLAEFTYRHLWGDKDTYALAWHRLGRRYARMWPTALLSPRAILHFDDQHQVLFQHRAADKFRLPGTIFDSNLQQHDAPQFDAALQLEQFCHDVCAELRQRLTDQGNTIQ